MYALHRYSREIARCAGLHYRETIVDGLSNRHVVQRAVVFLTKDDLCFANHYESGRKMSFSSF